MPSRWRRKAEDKGDHWVLNGQKLWITNAAEAGVFIVFANANPDAGYKGITAFIIERDFPGFTVGKKEDKLGIRASSTCELILEDCRVPKENVLGEAGKGYKIAIETLNEGRIGIGAQMIGVARGALEHAIAYVKERKQFGQPIAEFQGVQFQIAEAATRARGGAPDGLQRRAPEGRRSKPFLREAAMAKLFSSQVVREGDVAGGAALRRQRLHEGVSGREVLARLEGRTDLRGNVEHAARHDREDDPHGPAVGSAAPARPWRLFFFQNRCFPQPHAEHFQHCRERIQVRREHFERCRDRWITSS